jgi:hypothetical protein
MSGLLGRAVYRIPALSMGRPSLGMLHHLANLGNGVANQWGYFSLIELSSLAVPPIYDRTFTPTMAWALMAT